MLQASKKPSLAFAPKHTIGPLSQTKDLPNCKDLLAKHSSPLSERQMNQNQKPCKQRRMLQIPHPNQDICDKTAQIYEACDSEVQSLVRAKQNKQPTKQPNLNHHLQKQSARNKPSSKLKSLVLFGLTTPVQYKTTTRSIQQFLSNQQAFLQRSEEKLSSMIHEIQQRQSQQSTFKPALNYFPLKKKGQVHDRLSQKIVRNQANKFKGQVHYRHIVLPRQSQSHQKRESLNLLSDQKQKQMRKPFHSRTRSQHSIPSFNNQKFVINKVIKQVLVALKKHNISGDWLRQQQFYKVFGQMNFGSGPKLQKLWSILSHNITPRQVIQVVCAVLGICDLNLIRSCVQEYLQQNHNLKDMLECNIEMTTNQISEELSKQIKQQCQNMRSTRLMHNIHSPSPDKPLNSSQKQFKLPSGTDKQVRRSSKQRIPKTFLSPKLREKESVYKNPNNTSIQINNKSLNQSPQPTKKLSYKRIPALLKNRRMSTVNLQSVNLSSTPANKSIKPNTDRQIARMVASRQPKPSTGHDNCCHLCPKVPLFRLDVYIDQKQKHQLVIYEQQSPEQVARKFSNKFPISSQARKRLSEIILSQIKQAATQR